MTMAAGDFILYFIFCSVICIIGINKDKIYNYIKKILNKKNISKHQKFLIDIFKINNK